MGEVLIVTLTPLITAVLKRIASVIEKNVPRVWWPAMAPALGAIVNVLLPYFGVEGVEGTDAALLGMAGVGAREIVDQGKKARPSAGLGIVLLLVVPVVFFSCSANQVQRFNQTHWLYNAAGGAARDHCEGLAPNRSFCKAAATAIKESADTVELASVVINETPDAPDANAKILAALKAMDLVILRLSTDAASQGVE